MPRINIEVTLIGHYRPILGTNILGEGMAGAIRRKLRQFKNSKVEPHAPANPGETEFPDIDTNEDTTPNLAEMFDLIETDVRSMTQHAIIETQTISKTVAEKLVMTEQKVDAEISTQLDKISGATREADNDATMLKDKLTELDKGSATIRDDVASTTDLTRSASDMANEAAAKVEALAEAVERIENVVQMISDIAKQTNLLALNATIEAARAGEAGKGFAVVASEVKSLSQETQNATDEIAKHISGLQVAAQASIETVSGITGTIAEIGPVFDSVSDAVGQQLTTIQDLNENAERTAASIHSIAGTASAMSVVTGEIDQVNDTVSQSMDGMRGMIDQMSDRFIMLLRDSKVGNRREQDRIPIAINGQASIGGETYKATSVDISQAGALLQIESEKQFENGTKITLRLDGIGEIQAHTVGTCALGYNCAFTNIDESCRGILAQLLERETAQNERYIGSVKETSAKISAVFEKAIEDGKLNQRQLFDSNYKPVEGSNPLQYTNDALDVLEVILPPIQEPLLKATRNLKFCAASDRNSYIPVNNTAVSLPQRPDDIEWNIANCRNKRIFDDRAGVIASRNTSPYLLQSYPRDLGGGVVVMMKEFDAPIYVNGEHWGGFRMAYTL